METSMDKAIKILLVDDDLINNKLNLMILKKKKSVEIVKVCYNGAEALQFIKENCVEKETALFPNLILLDLKMPIMNGIEFMEYFQQLSSHVTNRIRIVILTSSSNNQDLDKVKKFNISGYITKPFKLEELEALLGGLK